MNPLEHNAPDEQWQQPSVSPSSAPYQTVSVADELSEDGRATDSDGAPLDDAPPSSKETLPSSATTEDDAALIKWQSTEYVHQDRSIVWYVLLAIVTVVLMIIANVLIKSITFMILLPVMAVTLVIYVRRPPVPNDYFVSRKGIHINDKLYTYDQFRSFGVTNHQGHNSVVLVPRKRFQLGQTIFFPEEVGEKLVDMLAARLPMKEVQPDLIDRILARLHI